MSSKTSTLPVDFREPHPAHPDGARLLAGREVSIEAWHPTLGGQRSEFHEFGVHPMSTQMSGFLCWLPWNKGDKGALKNK